MFYSRDNFNSPSDIMMYLRFSISTNTKLSKKRWNNATLNYHFPSESTRSFTEFTFSLILVLLVAVNVFPQNRYLQCTANLHYCTLLCLNVVWDRGE